MVRLGFVLISPTAFDRVKYFFITADMYKECDVKEFKVWSPSPWIRPVQFARHTPYFSKLGSDFRHKESTNTDKK